MVAAVAVGTTKSVDAGLLHLVNHMLYKALLFMSAGSLIYATGTGNAHDLLHQEGSENRLPVWRSLPVAAIGAIVGALAIAGTPLFNGYVSKYLLKYAMAGMGPAEYMLLIAGVGTSLSFCKFVYFGFIKPRPKILRPLTDTMQAAILCVSALCVLIGVFPALVQSIVPGATSLDVYSFSGVTGSLQYVVAGIVVFLFTHKILEKGIKAPVWMSIEYLIYLPLFTTCQKACEVVSRADRQIDNVYTISSNTMYRLAEKTAKFDGAVDDFYEKSADTARRFADTTKSFDENIDDMYEKSGEKLRRVAEGTRQFDENLNDAYDSSEEALRRMAASTSKFDEDVNELYEKTGRAARKMADGAKYFEDEVSPPDKRVKLKRWLHWKPGEFNIKNLNFDTLLIAIMLAIFLIVLIFSSTRG